MLDDHVTLSYTENIFIMVLCLVGIILNTGMLIIFCSKKQVRGSVYTTYMIQIAFTDLVVCAVWFIMASLLIDDVRKMQSIQHADVTDLEVDRRMWNEGRIPFYRFGLALYYLHYYFNIFLLAAMSVERCIAVWKSMRCLRHDIAHRIIVIVSVVMFVVALACALPGFVNPNLIKKVDFGQDPIGNRTGSNVTSRQHSSSTERWTLYVRCYELLRHAIDTNSTVVVDSDDISAAYCVEIMEADITKGLHLLNDSQVETDIFDKLLSPNNSNETDEVIDEMLNWENDYAFNEQYELPELNNTDFYNLPASSLGKEINPLTFFYTTIEWPPGSGVTVTVPYRAYYQELFTISWHAYPPAVESDYCKPNLSPGAQVYRVVVNLVIGFFIPFAAIVLSYSYIAFMIAKRARERMEEDESYGEETLSRRMSDFLKQFVSGGQHVRRTDGERTPPYRFSASPILRRSLRHKRLINDRNDTNNDSSSKEDRSRPTTACSTLTPQSPESPVGEVCFEASVPFLNGSADEPATPTSSPPLPPPIQLRRTSGCSASSSESFQTSQTSIQTSPGIRSTAPSFNKHDKFLVKRACSAEGNTTAPAQNGYQQRWPSEVLRSQSLDEERQKKSLNNNAKHPEENELPDTLERETYFNRMSGLSSRGGLYENESTPDGDIPRPYSQKSDSGRRNQFNRQISSTSGYRGRAYSGTSRASMANSNSNSNAGTLRKSFSQRHAERHMRVSQTIIMYVIVFSLTWLPQRIVETLYITKGLTSSSDYACHAAIIATRIVSFLSVLLNPIVYATTQRELRQYLSKFARVLPCARRRGDRREVGRVAANGGGRHRALVENELRDFSLMAEHNVTSDDVSKRERHLRNKELWTRMVQRLGHKGFRTSMTVSGWTGHGDKPSDDTIDEEKDEEVKGQFSKSQSSSGSIKLISNWEDLEQLWTTTKSDEPSQGKENIF